MSVPACEKTPDGHKCMYPLSADSRQHRNKAAPEFGHFGANIGSLKLMVHTMICSEETAYLLRQLNP
jgi:hypothetical protein